MPPETLCARLAAARSVMITSHASPDGDAIGTALGAARALDLAGKRVTVWMRDPVPTVYRALPGADAIHVGEQAPAGFPDEVELLLVLECPTLDRTGLETALAPVPKLNVDHHLGNGRYGVENWVDPDAPAVSVLMADVLLAIGAPIDEAVADCLLLGLVTDTGGFRFGNASPRAFRAAARFVELGARVETVSRWIYESQPEASVRLLGAMLGTLERHGPIATVHLTLGMFEQAGASTGDSEGLIDVPRSIAGVEAVALLREIGADLWKVSLRSRGTVDVERVARELGGGGHTNAAGCRIAGPLVAAQKSLVARLEDALRGDGEERLRAD